MILTCSKDKLLDNINIVMKSVSNRTTLPILSCVLINADDGLTLISNDLDMGIQTTEIEADISEPGSIALDAKLFNEIVRKITHEYITIRTDKNYLTQITGGKAEFKILGVSPEEFPMLPMVDKSTNFKMKASVLKQMVQQTIFSVASEGSKPVLTGELFKIDKNTLHIVSVDGFRISFAKNELANNELSISVVIPAKSLNELTKLLPSDSEADVGIYITGKHVLFHMESCDFVSRLLEGEFIKYDQIFNEDCNTILTVNRVEFLSALERASLIARESKKSPVRLDIGDETVKITSNTETGTMYDEMPADIDGNQMTIAFNPKYLIDALRAIDERVAVLKFTTALSPCIIKGMDNEKSKYLVLPLRMK